MQRVLSQIVTLAASAALLASSSAAADSVLVADPTAQNISAFGGTSAWSRHADDGTYRLVVRGPDGVPHDASVRSARAPFDPDVGPRKRGGQLVVYSRCARASSRFGCDVYAYDPSADSERKLTAISTSTGSEIGPSYFKGTIAFARSGRRRGLYVAVPGTRPRRIWSEVPNHTDLSATHVICGNAEIRLSRIDGTQARELDQTYHGEEAYSTASSPVLSRTRAYWLSGSGEYSGYEQSGAPYTLSVLSVALDSATGAAQASDRAFLDAARRPTAGSAVNDVNAIALGPSGAPELVSGGAGIVQLDPLPAFGF